MKFICNSYSMSIFPFTSMTHFTPTSVQVMRRPHLHFSPSFLLRNSPSPSRPYATLAEILARTYTPSAPSPMSNPAPPPPHQSRSHSNHHPRPRSRSGTGQPKTHPNRRNSNTFPSPRSPSAQAPPGANPEDIVYDVDSSDENIYDPHVKKTETRQQFKPSEEQQKVVRLARNHNVIVSARPGSGKTATAEAIVQSLPDERVAILTYSRRLMVETKGRMDKGKGLGNVKIWTFHAMACQLFGETIDNDSLLLHKKLDMEAGRIPPPTFHGEPFDVIIMDEFQDCTELIFWLVCVFIQANQQARSDRAARLVILGDERQAIYQFRGADARYLSMAPEIFGPLAGEVPWARVSLSKSFRMSHQTVNFINSAFLKGTPYIVGSKDGPVPIFLHANMFNENAIARKIFALIKKYGAQNTAILAPKVRRSKHLSALTNCLGEKYGIPIAVSTNDEAPLDDRVIEGKLSVSTIHQFKGSERDLVIVVGVASQSYFDFFARNEPADRCTNGQFVALTRARQRLVVLYEYGKDLVSFVDPNDVFNTAIWDHTHDIPKHKHDLKRAKPGVRKISEDLILPIETAVTDVIRHLKDEHIQRIINKYLEIIVLQEELPESQQIKMPIVIPSQWTIQQPPDPASGSDPNQPLTSTESSTPFYPQQEWEFHETVSDINGLVVVAAAEYLMSGTLSTLGLENTLEETKIRKLSTELTQDDVIWLCKMACEYDSTISRYKARWLQMQNHSYDWIKPADINMAARRLIDEIHPKKNHFLGFETNVSKTDYKLEREQMSLRGITDIVSVDTSIGINLHGVIDFDALPSPVSPQFNGCKKTLYEIKFTQDLGNEHVLQAAMYAHMIFLRTGKLPETTILFNVRTGEKWQVKPRDIDPTLAAFLEDVIRTKYTARKTVSDTLFLAECQRQREAAMKVFEHWGSTVETGTEVLEGDFDELDIEDESLRGTVEGTEMEEDIEMMDVDGMGVWGSNDHFKY